MLNADQPTPKYDQLKRRFMKQIVKEDSIQELQLVRLISPSQLWSDFLIFVGV